MKIAGYVARILFCKHCVNLATKINHNYRDIEFFLGDYFLARKIRRKHKCTNLDLVVAVIVQHKNPIELRVCTDDHIGRVFDAFS